VIRMGSNEDEKDWTPVGESERYMTLDLLRGFALFGVLIVNLLYFFRIPLFDHILHFHSHSGFVNHAIDLWVTEFVEFKAFDLFALTFGIGIAIQSERARKPSVTAEFFLLRRFLILLVAGICHMVLVSNVDILTLYAVCGLLIIALLRLPTAVLAVGGVAAIYLPSVIPGWQSLPPEATWQDFVANATRIYSTGSFGTIVAFRWLETKELILPLLMSVAQRTFGLMLIGVAVWRFGVIKESQRYRPLLLTICLGAGIVGLLNTTVRVLSQSTGKHVQHIPFLNMLGSDVLLAFAYAAAIIAWRHEGRASAITAPVAAMGRMALSNYLMQSIVFALLFYGYGFRLFGKLDPQTATVIGIAFYACQLWLSVWWSKQHRFGPFEWLWRSLTYGRRQPMRRFPNIRAAALPE
jgi:uncharacterized protein